MAVAQPVETRTGAGVATMMLAVVFFTAIDTSAKWLIMAGLPVLQVVFARYFGHLVVALVLFLPREGLIIFRSNRPGLQLMRSLFLMLGTALNFAALNWLPITVTTTIMFASPVVITLLAIPILGERVGLRRIIAVCTGFLGVIIVMQPWDAAFHPAMFLNLGAVTMASLYFIMTRKLAGIEGNSTQQIWSSGAAALTLFPFVVPIWTWPEGGMEWLIFAAIGTFGACGHIAVVISHRWADASLLAPVIYIQIFFAAAAGIFVFGQWPTVWTLGGGAVIIGSGIYIWQRERAKSRAA